MSKNRQSRAARAAGAAKAREARRKPRPVRTDLPPPREPDDDLIVIRITDAGRAALGGRHE